MGTQNGISAPIPTIVVVYQKIKMATMATMASQAETVSADATPPTMWQQSAEEDEDDDGSELDAEQLLTPEEDTETEDALTEASTSAYQNQGVSNYVAETFSFKDRLAFYAPGNVLKSQYEKAVQAACIFEAGHRVLEMGTKLEPDLKDLYVECYYGISQGGILGEWIHQT